MKKYRDRNLKEKFGTYFASQSSRTGVSFLLNRNQKGYANFIVNIIGDYQRGFRCNGSNIDHLFYIRQILEKKWEYTEAVHQLFIGFKKAYDSVRRKVL
jgi:hypothetical protein